MSQRVLFIGGLGRSGSTLVEKLLNEIPQTFAVGETIHLWERGVRNQERCGCGEAFAECPQWSAVGIKAFAGWEHVDLDDVVGLRWSVDRTRALPAIAAAARRGEASEDQSRYLDHLRTVLLAAAEVAGGPPVLVESSKHLSTAALLALDQSLNGKLDIRLLHLIRDPRGVAYSWTKQVARPETDGEAMPTYPPLRTAARWVSDNVGFELLARRVPTLRLRYEDFLSAPVESMRNIAALVDLDPDELDLSFFDPISASATLSRPMHSVAGNPLRFGGSTITLRLDDAWRDALPARQRALVNATTAPLRLRYGYR